MSNITDKLTELVMLEEEERQINDRLKAISKRKGELQEDILDNWADAGQQSATIGNFTIYVASDFVCGKRGGVETQHVCDVLERNGLGYLVAPSYNAGSLKSWVKEQRDSENPIPDDLEPLLNFQDIQRLRIRKK